VKNDTASDLDFFALLARHGNLSATARELNVTPPAVTKRLASMERRLGVRLMNRTTRRVNLTSEGETYLAHAVQIISQIRDMEEAVSSARAELKGLLRVNATLGFGRTVIAPLISTFAHRHPAVEIQLQLTDRPINLVDEQFDLGIHFGDLPDTRLNARRIMSNRRFLCASPAYLKQFGSPSSPSDLVNHRCIIHRQNDDAYGIWHFIKNRKSETVKVGGVLSSNDGDVVLGWALDGHGILMRSEWDLEKYLQTGRLQVVLKGINLPPADLFAFYLSKQNLPAKVRTFIDFLASSLERSSGPAS